MKRRGTRVKREREEKVKITEGDREKTMDRKLVRRGRGHDRRKVKGHREIRMEG